jgi:hypothetical protein
MKKRINPKSAKKQSYGLWFFSGSFVLALAVTAAVFATSCSAIGLYFKNQNSKQQTYQTTVSFTDSVQFVYDLSKMTLDKAGIRLKADNSLASVITLNPLSIPASSELIKFAENATKPKNSEITYQISNDQNSWYYFDGHDWKSTAGCPECGNTADEVNLHLASFILRTDGLQIRAILKAGDKTPTLRSLTLTVRGEQLGYLPAAHAAIPERLVRMASISPQDDAGNSCGYALPNENIIRGLEPAQGTTTTEDMLLKAWYNNDNAALLGVRKIVVKSVSTQAETDYAVSPLSTNPGGKENPDAGVTSLVGDQSGTDSAGWPLFPALFVTDVTNDPNNRSGDWQYGGLPVAPHGVYGTWRPAVKTIDNSSGPGAVSIKPDQNPTANNWNMDGGDTPPASMTDKGWGTEARWKLADLGLLPGHRYRMQVIMHSGKDDTTICYGEACLNGLHIDFLGSGRYGDNNAYGGTRELFLTEQTDQGLTTRELDNYEWTNGQNVSFSLSYDPTDGAVTYTLGSRTLSWNYAPNKAFEYIIPMAHGDTNGNRVDLTNLVLNGQSVPDVNSGDQYIGRRIPFSDQDQEGGFTLTGNVKLSWGTQTEDVPSFELYAMNTHELYPNDEKVTICHRTNSGQNPYVVIDVPQSAVDGQGNNDHSHHVADQTHPYGDIIPITDLNGDGGITVADCTYQPPPPPEDKTPICHKKNDVHASSDDGQQAVSYDFLLLSSSELTTHQAHQGDIIPITDRNDDGKIDLDDCGYTPPPEEKTPICHKKSQVHTSSDDGNNVDYGQPSSKYDFLELTDSEVQTHMGHSGDIIPITDRNDDGKIDLDDCGYTPPPEEDKIYICHKTDSHDNRYDVLRLSHSAVETHRDHDGDIIPITDRNDDGRIDEADCGHRPEQDHKDPVCYRHDNHYDFLQLTVDEMDDHQRRHSEITPIDDRNDDGKIDLDDCGYSPPREEGKVTICHRTNSDKNPYEVLDVPHSAVDGEGNNDHTSHVADQTHRYGDIIPITDRNHDGKTDERDCISHLSAAQTSNTLAQISVPKTIHIATAASTDGDVGMACTMVYIPAEEQSPPVANTDYATTTANHAITIDVANNDSDVDGDLDLASVATSTDPAHGTITNINHVTGEITYSPFEGYTGPDQFQYRICDLRAVCATATVNITILRAGERLPPNAENDVVSTSFNTTVEISVLNNDSDVDGYLVTSTLRIITPPQNGTTTRFDPETGKIYYTPDLNYSGADSFVYQICDNDELCATATVNITISQGGGGGGEGRIDAVNDQASTVTNIPITINILANDTDPNNHISATSVTIIVNPTWGVITNISPTSGSVTYQPNNGFVGSDTFTYQVCNIEGQCDTAIVTISVTSGSTGGGGGEKVPPVAVDDDYSTPLNTPTTFNVLYNDYDRDGVLDPSTLVIDNGPQHGTLSNIQRGTSTSILPPIPVPGDMTYTPNPGYVGTDTFKYTICDNTALCDSALVTIHIGTGGGGGGDTPGGPTPGPGVKLPPTANDDTATTPAGTSVIVDVLANDVDPDGTLNPNTVQIVQSPGNGTTGVDSATGRITYTPNSGFSGVDTFIYQVCDNDGFCDTATVRVTVVAPTPLIVPALALPVVPLPPTAAGVAIDVRHCNVTIASTPTLTMTGTLTPAPAADTVVQYSMNQGASWNAVASVSRPGPADTGIFSFPLFDLPTGSYSAVVRTILPDGRMLSSVVCPFGIAGDMTLGANQFTLDQTPSPLTVHGAVIFTPNVPQKIYVEATALAVSIVDTRTGKVFSLSFDQDLHLWSGDLVFTERGVHPLRADLSNGVTSYSRDINQIQVIEPKGITDATGKALDGVKVTVWQQENYDYRIWQGAQFGMPNPVYTDNQGRFAFTLPTGRYYLTLEKDGFAPATSLITDLSGNSMITADFALQPVQGLYGQFLDAVFLGNPATNFPLAVTPLVSESTQEGKKVADFTYTAQDGTTATLYGNLLNQNKPAVLFVYGPWNTRVQEQMNIFLEVRRALAADATLLPLTSYYSQEAIQGYVDRGNYNVTVNVPENAFYDKWGVTSLPSFYVVKPDGTMLRVIVGSQSAPQLIEAIRNALAQTP